MIELAKWLATERFAARPWLLLGKGPTFSRRAEFDLGAFNLFGLNHVVRELPVDVAHVVDVDVVTACAERLLANARWLVMPRHPHVDCKPDPGRRLESFFASHPVLRQFSEQGRLVWYDLRSKTCPALGESPPIKVRFFSSEAALRLLARMGANTVRSLGIDGGRAYSPSFGDVQQQTLLANRQPTFDLQFAEIDKIVRECGLDYAPLIAPMRIFVGGDETEWVPAKVLEHSIRRYASGPVEVTIMRDLAIPPPKAEKNRPRTKFSFYRFKIPELCGYRGRALYLDSDMQVFRDVAELWRIPFGSRRILCTRQDTPPPGWQDNTWFHPGRQFSVMLLDCDRLDWRIDEIVRALDEGRFGYQDLMFRMCLVRDDEIGEDVPPEWNCLEHHEPGKTALTHFTVVPTQPWKTDRTPLNALWMADYERAVAAGAIDPQQVRDGIRRGFYKPGLEPALAGAPAFWSWVDPDAKVRPPSAPEHEVRAQRSSLAWRVARFFTRPFLQRSGDP
jgi:hypothetical protein